MNIDELRPGGTRHNQLTDRIDGIDYMLDTPCDLTVPGQMLSIGHGLFIPKTVRAYHIAIDGHIVINFMEVRYNEKAQRFVTCRLDLEVVGGDLPPYGITNTRLTGIAIERIKRDILGKWILRDRGTEWGLQRWQTWQSYLQGNPVMLSKRGGDMAMIDVARLYAVAKYSNTDVRAEVARLFHVSGATASRWIAKAKEQGFIKE